MAVRGRVHAAAVAARVVDRAALPALNAAALLALMRPVVSLHAVARGDGSRAIRCEFLQERPAERARQRGRAYWHIPPVQIAFVPHGVPSGR